MVVNQNGREPHDLLSRSRYVIGLVNSAGRGALVREMSPAEESAESAAKERQFVRYHESEEREKSANRATA